MTVTADDGFGAPHQETPQQQLPFSLVNYRRISGETVMSGHLASQLTCNTEKEQDHPFPLL